MSTLTASVAVASDGNGSAADVFDLAMAVAKPGSRATRLDVDNKAAGRCSIRAAADSGESFYVTVASDILALDFDDPSHLPVVDAVVRLLNTLGVESVVVASGRDGHRHVFALVTDEARQQAEALAVEMTGSRSVLRQAIRPPLSPHRLGLPVSLVEPDSAEGARRRLSRPEGVQAPAPAGYRRLSDRTYRLLRTGVDPAGPGRSRSEVLFSVALGMANRCWSEERAYRLISNPQNRAGEKVQEIAEDRGEVAARRYFHHTWTRVEKYAAEEPPVQDRKEAVALISSMKHTVLEAQWPGAQRMRVRAVLLALLDLALKAGSLTVHASTRQLAEASGLTRQTIAGTYLPVLTREGWIKKPDKTAVGKTTSYHLVEKTFRTFPISTTPKGCEALGQDLHVSHDAFRAGGGVGKTGHAILAAMEEPRTASEIAMLAGSTVATTRRILNLLATTGVVTKHLQVWARADVERLGPALDTYAFAAGVATKGARQRAVHKAEQDAEQEWLAGKAYAVLKVPCAAGWASVAGQRYWPRGRAFDGCPEGGGFIPVVLVSNGMGGYPEGIIFSVAAPEPVSVRSIGGPG